MFWMSIQLHESLSTGEKHWSSCTDVILKEFDDRIFSFEKLPFFPVEDIIGASCYTLWRLSGNSVLKETLLKTIWPEIVQSMVKWSEKNNP